MAKNVQIKVDINTKDGKKSMGKLNKESKQVLSTLGQLEKKSSQLNQEIKNVDIGTQEYKELKREIISVNGALSEQSLAMESLNSQQMATEIGSVASGIASVTTAAYALTDAFGLTNDSTEVFVKNIGTGLSVAQGFSGGLQGVISLQKLMKTSTIGTTVATEASTVATVGNTVATEAETVALGTETVATEGASVAMGIFNAVAAANPIGLLIIALVAAVAAFTIFSSSSKDAADDTDDLAESNEELNKKLNKQNELIKTRNDLINKKSSLLHSKKELLIQGKLIKLNQQLNDLKSEAVVDDEASLKKHDEAILKKEKEIYATEKALVREKYAFKKEQLKKDIKDKTEQIEKFSEDQKKKEKQDKINRYYNRMGGGTSPKTKFTDEQQENEDNNDILIKQREVLKQKLENIDISLANDLSKLNKKSSKDIKAGDEEVVEHKIGLNNLDYLKTVELLSKELLLEIEHQKSVELIKANRIEDEEERNKKIEEIYKKYLDKETKALKDNSDDQIAVLRKQKDKDVKEAGDNKEKILKIEAQFATDKAEIYRDLDNNLIDLNNQTLDAMVEDQISANEKLKNSIKDAGHELLSTLEESTNTIVSGIATALDDALFGEDGIFSKLEDGTLSVMDGIETAVTAVTESLQSVFDSQQEKESQKRDERFEADTESLKSQLANREISQEKFEAKMRLLQQRKAEEELQAKRKAFKQEKALQITTALMQTAQAVIAAFSGGSATPIAGVALGPAMAIVAGALGAAQIGIISAQKFKASKGGIVPGNGPSHLDSVESLLAPGEIVINSRSASMFPNELSTLNQLGGGVSLAPKTTSVGRNQNNNNSVYTNGDQRIILVESDVTNSIRRVSRIEESSSFGKRG